MLGEDEKTQESYISIAKFEPVKLRNLKRKFYEHIDSYYPKERYQADTVYLSDYLVLDKRYLLTMIDHFNKYGWIVVLSDKSATTKLRAVKACIATHGKPKSLQTDTGSEFVNEELKMYLSKN